MRTTMKTRRPRVLSAAVVPVASLLPAEATSEEVVVAVVSLPVEDEVVTVGVAEAATVAVSAAVVTAVASVVVAAETVAAVEVATVAASVVVAAVATVVAAVVVAVAVAAVAVVVVASKSQRSKVPIIHSFKIT